MLFPREVTQQYRIPRLRSEPPHKGCADLGSQITGTLTWAICQKPDLTLSQLPVPSLRVFHSSILRGSGPLLCQRNGFLPCVSSISLGLDHLKHWVHFCSATRSTQAIHVLTLASVYSSVKQGQWSLPSEPGNQVWGSAKEKVVAGFFLLYTWKGFSLARVSFFRVSNTHHWV